MPQAAAGCIPRAWSTGVPNSEITATYDAKGKDQCDYTIVVRDSNGGLHDTIFRGAIEGGGGPTIKNN